MGSLSRDVASVVLSKGVVRITQAVAFIVLARALSPSDFAWFGIVTTMTITATTLGSLGLRQSLAAAVGRRDVQMARAVTTAVAAALPLSLVSSTACIVLLGDSAPQIPQNILSATLALGIVFSMILTLLQGPFLGAGDIRRFNAANAAPRVTFAACVVLLAWIGSLDLKYALISYACGFAMTAPVIAYSAARMYGVGAPLLRRALPLVRSGLVFALNLSIFAFLPRVGIFVLERRNDPTSAGIFFATTRYAELLLEVATAIGLVTFSRTVRADGKAEAVVAASSVAAATMVVFTVLGAASIPLAVWAIPTVLGPEYSEISLPLSIASLGLGFAAANKVMYSAIAGGGSPGLGTPVMFTGATVNIGLAILLAPSIEVAGVAIALVAAQITIYLGFAAVLHLRMGVPLKSIIWPRIRLIRAVRTR